MKSTNALIHETSPYLLQHAHNPVNWFPWGEEALQKAKAEDKPILVSIGYAACHWCHVMERESFEDESTAALMNEYFISIKIDREERPDLDHIYMDAVQAMSGSGGWPLNVFLTPDTKPFFGGTYFPPVRAHNRASWKEVLEGIHKSYAEKKNEVVAQAENLVAHMSSANAFGIQKPGEAILFSGEQLQMIAEGILANADKEWGGFGAAPKFPQSFSIQYLLRHYHFTKQENALQQALLSLDKMIDGGIYDQLGGGFARYSTDNEWLAPHFEKMLYDNALLIGVLSEAYQLTKNKKYADTIRHTLAFIEREMLSSEGGFYSALDADSEGVEGKFYVWSKKEIDELLGDEAQLFSDFYDVSQEGNWEHASILRVLKPLTLFTQEHARLQTPDSRLTEAAISEKLSASRKILMSYRSKRIRPQLDDKILLGWNALMNTAYSKAYAALGDVAYKEMAVRNMRFLESKFPANDGSWQHTYKNGAARIGAFLDDYAYLIQSYIHLQEITGNGEYLIKAEKLTAWVIGYFEEEETGFFFYTNKHQSDVIVRKKEVYDGAVPSGNAVMVHNLLYLSIVFDKPEWAERTHDLIRSLNRAITRYPGSFGVWALAQQLITQGMVEIAITGQHAEEGLSPVLGKFIPNKILQVEETNSHFFPLLAGKTGVAKERAFYLCKNYACKAPFLKVEDLLANV
jgi:uncharacterized protein YyaL (SSP411 family)